MLLNCPACGAEVDSHQFTGSCPHCDAPLTLVSPPQVDGEEAADGERREFFRRLLEATPNLYATPALLGLNVIVFVIMVLSGVDLMNPRGDDLLKWGANYGPRALTDEGWRFFSSMFLHIGIVHLAFNMYALRALGQFVERLCGPLTFLGLYLISGLAGSLASVWWNPQVLSAGASGAVFGVMGVLGGMLLRRSSAVPMSVARSLRRSVGMFLLFNLAFGLLVPNIDQAAHLGGLLTGLAGGLFIRGPLLRERLSLAHRWAVNGAVIAILGCGVAAAWVQLHTQLGPNLHALLEIDALVTKFDQSLTDRDEGRVSDRQLAEMLEKETLPAWRTYRASLENIGSQELLAYVAAQQTEWEVLLKFLREPRASARDRLFKQYREAQRASEKMRQAIAAGS